MDITGQAVWHAMLALAGTGEAGNGPATSDAFRLVKDSLNFLEARAQPVFRLRTVNLAGQTVNSARPLLGVMSAGGSVAHIVTTLPMRVLLVAVLQSFVITGSAFPVFGELLGATAEEAVGQGVNVGLSMTSAMWFASGDLAAGSWRPSITHPGIGGTLTFGAGGSAMFLAVLFPPENSP